MPAFEPAVNAEIQNLRLDERGSSAENPGPVYLHLKKELTLKERFNNLKLLVKNSGAGKMIEGLRGSREMDPKDAEYLKYITEMYNNNIVTESEFMSMKERLDRLGIWA